MDKILKISVWGTIIGGVAATLHYFFYFHMDDRYDITFPLFTLHNLILGFFFYSFLKKERGLIGLISDALIILTSMLLIIKYYPYNQVDIIFHSLLIVFIILIRINKKSFFKKDNFTGQL